MPLRLADRQVETRLNELCGASSRLNRVLSHHRPHGTCLQAFSQKEVLVGSVWVLSVATCVDPRVFPRAAQQSGMTPEQTVAESSAEQAGKDAHTAGSQVLDQLLLDRLGSVASERKAVEAAPPQARTIEGDGSRLFFHMLLMDEAQVVCGPKQTNAYLLRKGVGQGCVEASQVGCGSLERIS